MTQAITKSRSWVKTLIKVIGALILLLFLFILFFYFAVRLGFFGSIPSKEELFNVKNPVASEIVASDGKTILGKYYLENRSQVAFGDISQYLTQALVATEDERFFEHKGVDLRSVGRVLVKSILMGDRSAGGGSTLSQQLAKNLYPRQDHGRLSMPVNKVREMIIASRLENIYSKKELITLYLNTVSFGERAFGIGTATERFFSTTPKDILPEEAAVLIGMLKAPTAYSPRLNPEKSQERRNVVLGQMVKKGYISEANATTLQQKPLVLKYNRKTQSDGLAPYFRRVLRDELKKWSTNNVKLDGSKHNIFKDGLKIFTTIDPKMQQYAEEAVVDHLFNLQATFFDHWDADYPWGEDESVIDAAIQSSRRYKRLKKAGWSENKIEDNFNKKTSMILYSKDKEQDVMMTPLDSVIYYLHFLHAGFMAMDPHTGEVKAWVGDMDYDYFQKDYVRNQRQVGSTFKPLVYASALENGIAPCQYYPNERFVYKEYDDWSPRNADNEYGGAYSMYGGLAKSVNTVSVQVLFDVGLDKVMQQAQRQGIENEIPKVPSIALGTAELSLQEMVNAYAPFANGGYGVKPILWTHIEDVNGKIIAQNAQTTQQKKQKAMSSATASTMTQMLQTVVDAGTGQRLRWKYNLQGEIAGKTGTTQNHTDGWFIGYTPALLAGAWVGGENRTVRFRDITNGQGANTALPIWGLFFQKLAQDPLFQGLAENQFGNGQGIVADVSCDLYSKNGKGNRPENSDIADAGRNDNTDIFFPKAIKKIEDEGLITVIGKALFGDNKKWKKKSKKKNKASLKDTPEKFAKTKVNSKKEEKARKEAEEERKKVEEEREKMEKEQRKKERENREKAEEERKKAEEEQRKQERENKKKVEEQRKKAQEERKKIEEERKKIEKEAKKKRKKLEKERKKKERERKRKKKKRDD